MSPPGIRTSDTEKFSTNFTYESEPITSPLSGTTSRSTQSKRKITHVNRPWRHSVSHHLYSSDVPPASPTVRQFRPARQRKRLFVTAFLQWLITVLFCAALALLLWGFSQLALMRVWQVKMFNALVVLASMWLGTNLNGSLREYALMMRWRILAMKYRNLDEMDLIMNCESLRAVFKLFFLAKPRRGWGLSTTQVGCALWMAINLALAVLVALLGLTYNISTSDYPELHFGLISVANMTIVRDIWGADDPSYYAQLGSANSFGIQGQDYNFTDQPVPGQNGLTVYGSPMTPNIYTLDSWATFRYFFMDLNLDNPNLSILSKRNIGVQASCREYTVVSGGYGISPFITYINEANTATTLNVARVGPGSMTYIGVLNSTCGPRCTEIYALQSADNATIPVPTFYKCNNTITPVSGIPPYIQPNQTRDLYDLADTQARIFAGAIGWTGFNFTANDNFQYVRYSLDSWWSPNAPTNATHVAERIMEFAIEAIAAFDNNGPRMIVAGRFPVPSQCVQVIWKWAVTLLAVIPGLHAIAMVGVVWWAGEVVIRDQSCLSVATLLRPLVARLGDHGCLLSGAEIAEAGVLEGVRVRYGVEKGVGGEEEVRDGLRFENQIVVGERVRHVGMLEEGAGGMEEGREGEGGSGSMKERFPAGLYDGSGQADGAVMRRRKGILVSWRGTRVSMHMRTKQKSKVIDKRQ